MIKDIYHYAPPAGLLRPWQDQAPTISQAEISPQQETWAGCPVPPLSRGNSSGILDGAHPHTEIVGGMVGEAQN